MPTYMKGKMSRRLKPWHARVQLDGKVYSLGYHRTEWEAAMTETGFKIQLHELNGKKIPIETLDSNPHSIV